MKKYFISSLVYRILFSTGLSSSSWKRIYQFRCNEYPHRPSLREVYRFILQSFSSGYWIFYGKNFSVKSKHDWYYDFRLAYFYHRVCTARNTGLATWDAGLNSISLGLHPQKPVPDTCIPFLLLQSSGSMETVYTSRIKEWGACRSLPVSESVPVTGSPLPPLHHLNCLSIISNVYKCLL